MKRAQWNKKRKFSTQFFFKLLLTYALPFDYASSLNSELCVSAAGRPSWPGCHCVPCQSAADPEGQELPTQCRGQRNKHPDHDMNLCWNEIKRKSHNIRYITSFVHPSIISAFYYVQCLLGIINLVSVAPVRDPHIAILPVSEALMKPLIEFGLFCMPFVCMPVCNAVCYVYILSLDPNFSLGKNVPGRDWFRHLDSTG